MNLNPPPRVARDMMMTAIGNSDKEAREALREQKRELVPIAKLDLPEALNPELVDAELDRRVACLLWDVAELKTILLRAGDLVPRAYRQTALMVLYEIWTSADDLYQSLHDREQLGSAGGTLAGWIMRKQRLGVVGEDVQLSWGPPEKK